MAVRVIAFLRLPSPNPPGALLKCAAGGRGPGETVPRREQPAPRCCRAGVLDKASDDRLRFPRWWCNISEKQIFGQVHPEVSWYPV